MSPNTEDGSIGQSYVDERECVWVGKWILLEYIHLPRDFLYVHYDYLEYRIALQRSIKLQCVNFDYSYYSYYSDSKRLL